MSDDEPTPVIPQMPSEPGPWYLVRFDNGVYVWMHEDWLQADEPDAC